MDINDTEQWQRPLIDDRLTPYIEVDSVRLDQNLQLMQQKANEAGVALRPHIKTHKSIRIAQRQLALGARGITVSKPSEGITFILGGVRDLLLAYPIVHPKNVADLLRQAEQHQARLTLIADRTEGVAAITKACQQQPACEVSVAIKVDVGLHRIGVNPDTDEAIVIAQALKENGLRFAGLISHAGHAYGAGHATAIAAIARQETHLMQRLQAKLQAAGFTDCPLSVGSTPTTLAAEIAPCLDEIRPGNYALLDLTACRLGLSRVDQLAMSVITRVVAVNDHFVIVDAGSKMLSSDKGPHGTSASGFGIAVDEAGHTYKLTKLSEEHGFLLYQDRRPDVGSLLRIFPNHSCAVMAQSDSFVLRHPDGQSETQPVSARGNFI